MRSLGQNQGMISYRLSHFGSDTCARARVGRGHVTRHVPYRYTVRTAGSVLGGDAHTDVLEKLLEAGALPNAPDAKGTTALQAASTLKLPHVCSVLAGSWRQVRAARASRRAGLADGRLGQQRRDGGGLAARRRLHQRGRQEAAHRHARGERQRLRGVPRGAAGARRRWRSSDGCDARRHWCC